MNRLLAILILVVVSLKAQGATYYVDYAGGSDTNNGTSTGTAWKLAPGMTGFAGSYSAASGDQIILKGGVTWSNTCFPASITLNNGYYGVASNWYAGGAFTRPKFDLSGIIWPSGHVMVLTDCNKTTVDSIEFLGLRFTNTLSADSGYFKTVNGSSNILRSCYFHNWDMPSPGGAGGYLYATMCSGTMDFEVSNCTFDAEDGPLALQTYGLGNGIYGGTRIRANTVHGYVNTIHTSDSLSGQMDVASNIVYNIRPVPPGSGAHGNAIYTFTGGSVHHNQVYDVTSGFQAIYCAIGHGCASYTITVYDNLIWNIGMAPPICFSNEGCETRPPYNEVRVYNNSLITSISGTGDTYGVAGPNPAHQQFDNAWVYNNFIITTEPEATTDFTTVDNLYTNFNVLMSSNAAVAAGYWTGSAFAAPGTNDTTLRGQGTNLTSLFTTDFSGNSRSATGNWDIGAYVAGGLSQEGTIETNTPTAGPANVGTLRIGTLIIQ